MCRHNEQCIWGTMFSMWNMMFSQLMSDVFIVPPFCLPSWLLQTSWSLIVNSAFETGGFRGGTWCFHSQLMFFIVPSCLSFWFLQTSWSLIAWCQHLGGRKSAVLGDDVSYVGHAVSEDCSHCFKSRSKWTSGALTLPADSFWKWWQK